MELVILIELTFLCAVQIVQLVVLSEISAHHNGLKIFLEKWFKKMEGKNE